MTSIINFFTASLQRKILSSFAIVIVLVLVMVSLSYYQLNQVKNSAKQITPDSLQLNDLQKVLSLLTSLEANLDRFFVIGGTKFQENVLSDLETMATTLGILKDNAGDDDDVQVISDVEKKSNTLASDIRTLVGAEYAELSSREMNEKIVSVYAQIDDIKQLTEELSVTELNQLQSSALQQERIASNVMIQFLVMGALVALVVVGASVAVTRNIATRLAGLAQAAVRIAEGDLGAAVPMVKQKDEVGRLAQAFSSMTGQLRQMIGLLEEQVQQVQARTAELALSMEVGQRVSAIRNMDELLPTITEFIRDRFELYFTHVYFVDDIGENLVIKAGTGDLGQQLLARRHTLPVGPGSIVGQAAATGQSIVVTNTETSDIHKRNPLLPDTRSELAVPLVVEGQVLGVLDMQSDQVDTFTEANLTVFEAMATQLAISIDSAQQWTRSQEAQQRAEDALRQLTRETWTERLSREKKEVGFVYDLSTVRPVSPLEPATEANGFSVPLVVQSQQIGRLAVATPPDQSWSEDEQDLLSAVAEQLAQKAENLRLFEQTQERAGREQLTRQIADKVRASRDIETALKTAAEELSKVLGTTRAVIDLNVESGNGGNGQALEAELEKHTNQAG